MFLSLILAFESSVAWGAPKVKCIQFSESCHACSDRLNRKKPISDLKDAKLVGLVSNSVCAQSSAKTRQACAQLSEFCSFCPDGSFESAKRQKMKVDLYECMTKPRSMRTSQGR